VTETEFIPAGFGCGPGPHVHPLGQAAVLLGIGKSTLKKRVAARAVPFTNPAGVNIITFSDDDLRAIIAAGRKPTTAESRPRPTSARRRS
jgi:hypothetical protein